MGHFEDANHRIVGGRDVSGAQQGVSEREFHVGLSAGDPNLPDQDICELEGVSR